MTSSNPNSPTNSPLNFRPFALGKRGQKFRFIPTNSVGLAKPVITQALQTGGDAIQVTWGESGGTSYALQVSTNGGTTFSDVTTTAGTSFTHTGLSFPGSYTYRVRATVDAEVSDWSDSVTETMVDVPAAPGGLTVTGATTSSISLSWNDTADEGSYSIEASVDGLGSWSGVGSTGQNVVTFTHSGLSESVQRHYRVTAFNKAGGSIPSSTTNSWTVPAAPTGLTATAISTTQIDLSWTDVSTGNQSYKVERSTDNVNWTEIATGLSATATTYSATGLTASTQYWFRVRAANAARNSNYSNTASATTQASTTVPNAPSFLNATSDFADSVSLSWTDNSSGTGQETGFDIEVSTNSGSTYSAVATTAPNATSYTHTGRVESTTYLYRIRATNSAGSSSWVVGDDVTTPAALTNLTATAVSSSQINLSWTDKSGVETGFRIEYSEDNFNWSLLTTTAANATSYSNTLLNPSTTYWYRIRSNSYNGTNDSTWYSASATTQAAAGVPTPTFEVNFTTDPYVGTRFSRASRATFVNSSGFIQDAERNLVHHSEDLSATTAGWVRDGLQAFGSGSTVNAATAPDGSTTADLITETNVNGQHGMYSNGNGLNLTYGTQYTISLYAKKPTSNGRDHVSVGMAAGGTGLVVFNLTNGTYTTNVGWASMTLHSYSIQSVGSGWYRCIVTFSATGTGSTGTGSVRIGPSTAAPTNYFGFPSYAGDGVSGVLVWGVQLVQGSSALPYVRTPTTAPVGTPRITHDPVTLAPLGLLMEAQATNHVANSENWSATATWTLGGVTQTASAATSPANLSTATRLVEDTSGGGHNSYAFAPSSTNFCFSVFLKAGQRTATSLSLWANANDWVACAFNLSAGTAGTLDAGSSSAWTGATSGIQNMGNGWYRCWVTGTRATANAPICNIALNTTPTPTRFASNGVEYYSGNTANGVLVWGAQIETTNAVPTSYIPTSGSTVTRSADAWNILSAEMSTLWNQSQGSLVAKGRIYTPFTNGGLVRTGVASSNANGYFTSVAASQVRPAIRVAGVNFNSGPTGAPTSGAVVNTGYSYNQATPAFTGFVGGTAGSTLTNSLSAVTIDKLEVGSRIENNMGSVTTYGTASSVYIIERLRYWNTALSNADMQTATT